MFYNYIFIFENVSYANIQYSDLSSSSFSQYIPLDLHLWKYKSNKKSLLDYFWRLHFSRKINRIVSLPFKNLWKKTLFNFSIKDTFDLTKPFCFIIHARCYIKYRNFLLNYLRKTYKNCLIIIYFTDLYINHDFNLKKEKKYFDAIFTFDKQDAKKYDFIHCDNPYSKINVIGSELKSDVFFIGNGKNRLKTILKIYEYLTNNGLNCDFYITGVKDDEQVFKDKINYNKYLNYNDVIKHVISTNCILEILQDGASSPTLRPLEAICYNKKLLSNCKEIINMEYYTPEYMKIFDSYNDIDINFIKEDIEPIIYNYAQKLSPVEMIKDIDLNIHNYLSQFKSKL